MQNIALFVLAALAVGGVAWVFIYPMLSGEQKAEKRKESLVRTGTAALEGRKAIVLQRVDACGVGSAPGHGTGTESSRQQNSTFVRTPDVSANGYRSRMPMARASSLAATLAMIDVANMMRTKNAVQPGSA